jgi:hypothetical protein
VQADDKLTAFLEPERVTLESMCFSNAQQLGTILAVFAPLVAVGLLWTRYIRLALWLFLTALCASLFFGIYYHYVFVSAENIHHLPSGTAATHARFALSAAILGLIELASALCAAFAL